MIRRAKVSDADQILKLLGEVNMIHHIGRPDIFNIGTKYTKEELYTKFKNEPIFVFVEDEVVLGYLFGLFTENKCQMLANIKTFFIDDLCVEENSRNKHVGSQLYKYACNYAKENGCYNITLNVWAFNNKARKFYEKIGMKELERKMEHIL